MDNLPDNYDLVVIGTGMPECIVAAAASRIGKSVLHIDRNQYYGGLWSSFNLEYLIQWINTQQELTLPPSPRILEAQWLEQLNDNEHLVLCEKDTALISDVIQKSYFSAIAPPEPVSSEELVEPSCENTEITENVEGCSSTLAEASTESETETRHDEPEEMSNLADLSTEQSSESAINDENSTTSPDVENSDVNSSNVEQNEPCSSAAANSMPSLPEVPQIQWTMEELLRNRQKFNIDLSPKILFSRGSLVELLISSNTARYAEFQGVNRILTYIDGHLEQVPCSRADVFSTKNVNVVEKRMLMKLLTFCSEYQKHPEEYRGFEGRPFIDFLKSRKTTANIEHYVMHAIAMVDDSCLTLQGLHATQKFMESLGRFGNSPFLWTCYGSGELPQSFCRLCAVFGGIYYLGRSLEAIVLDSDNRCTGIISNGKKLKSPSIVMEYSYLPQQYHPQVQLEMVSRAIYITDSSIMPAERQQNTLLRLPPVPGVRNAVTVLEFGSMSFICPANLYVVHMTCRSHGASAKDDFELAEKELFMALGEDNDSIEKEDKPKVLWSLHFKLYDTTVMDVNALAPQGIFVTSSPGLGLDYDYAVAEARDIFEKIYPGEEFLPRAPDPEDIVMEEYSNPGHEKEPDSDGKTDEGEPEVISVSADQCTTDQQNQDRGDDETLIEKGIDALEHNKE